ncbi:MAG: hypothetical protein CVU46_06020 [Chloroflexi bacterium HGW-Chloroflexi-8]|nr:MAG: hypothetical protein CVU46_06020 [Chloroflexi bacterium HGW-Chloroflexi-8]
MNRKSFLYAIWFTVLILIPFTSLPLASQVLQSDMVAAPSIIPLILMVIVWFIPTFFRQKLNDISFPLLFFLVYCIFVSMITLFINIPIQKNFSVTGNILEAYGTLIIGIAFFIIPTHYIISLKQTKQALKIIYWTFLPIFLWSILQFCLDRMMGGYPPWMEEIQRYFSTSGLLYRGRVTGFAYEPSWLAHQLNILYIPLFLGTSLSGYSILNKRIALLSIENILLFGSILLLFLTKSRIGWISFAFCMIYAFLLLYKYLFQKLRKKFFHISRRIWKVIFPLLATIIFVFVIFTGLLVSSKIDPRMEKVLKVETYQNRDLFSIANDFFFAERILYWQTGWEIFNDHPVIGVGLGNFGFYFQRYMPDFASALDEPREILFRANYQANNKNLWTRLLSETGIIGFILFFSWLIILWIQGSELLKNPKSEISFWGHVVKIVLIALIFEGFSVDSFALPYYWLILGISSAVFYLNKNLQISNPV